MQPFTPPRQDARLRAPGRRTWPRALRAPLSAQLHAVIRLQISRLVTGFACGSGRRTVSMHVPRHMMLAGVAMGVWLG